MIYIIFAQLVFLLFHSQPFSFSQNLTEKSFLTLGIDITDDNQILVGGDNYKTFIYILSSNSFSSLQTLTES